MNTEDIAWFTLLLPLVSAIIITLFTRKDAKFSAIFSIAAVVLSFGISLLLFLSLYEVVQSDVRFAVSNLGKWLEGFTKFEPDLSLRLDTLSLLMMVIVTGVGGAIHIYSYGYMKGDPGGGRYFAGLSLFTFAMLGIVLATNFIMLFIFWELVGLSSYLLIGFWYERPSAADASKKAFLTNRLGDFGFMLGILLVWGTLGSFEFDAIAGIIRAHPNALGAYSTIAGLLIFCGAMAKSAQFPLHVWLPDAMEGPTPVSALIHAATMVAAGVYMLCRVFFIYQATPAWPAGLSFLNGITALNVIAWLGAFTALLSAVIAVQQNDIKRILAYSTLSQLGYMVMTVGLKGPSPAMFHLTTHAFFKALLFLGAGSVIHMLHHQQDIWKMGGLWKKMPITFWTFLFATLALCGVPPFSGFYSKDVILATAHDQNTILFMVATFVALLTTLYMFRLLFVAFLGAPREEGAAHAKESPPVMSWILVALAVPTVIAGLCGINSYLDHHFIQGRQHVATLVWYKQILAPFSHAPLAAVAGLGAVLFGFFFAYGLYANAAEDPLPKHLGFLARAMRNRFYFDEIYRILILITHEASSCIAGWADRWLVGGLMVRGIHGTTEIAGRALRLMQTGNLQTYAFWAVLGLAVILYLVLR